MNNILSANAMIDPAEAEELSPCVELTVVLPTYNERRNVMELIGVLERVLKGIRWEVVVVDDDSPDGTAEVACELARRDRRVRAIRRVGRRGLSSACIEGILSSSAPYVAVMDADLQHDENVLPKMLERMQAEALDVVVGTRNGDGGNMGQFARRRVMLSRLGERISQTVCRLRLSDPMSGFFMLRREFFLEVVHDLQGGGFKILVDILASSKRPVRLGEVGYRFRNRRHGDSKLDVNAGVEYLFLVINKVTGGMIPVRFAVFSLVGATGLITHLLALSVFVLAFHLSFSWGQALATFIAMTANFFLNNLITYRDRKLRGMRLCLGWVTFCVACSFGAWANVVFARSLIPMGVPWLVAGLGGIVISSVWNYSVSSLFTWQTPRRGATLD
jgi:dolichol-phosphate mannosyltransferase